MMTEWYIKIFAANPCSGNNFFGFPTWYKYLKSADPNTCSPKLDGIMDIWLIAFAVVEMLLRVAIIAAIAYIIIGGFKYTISRDNPDKTAAARSTIIDAIIGLVIAVAATAVVSFVAGQFE